MRIKLPQPLPIDYPLGKAVIKRRSRRRWLNKPIELDKIATILWATQGITDPGRGFRAVPSAGATYPLELYLVAENVTGLDKGVYHYIPWDHELSLVRKGSYSIELEKACLGQEWVGSAPANIVIAAVFERTTRFYGRRGIGYVYMEVGHAGQNIYLVAEALGLGTVAVGAFIDEEVSKIIGLHKDEQPLYIMPIGYPLGVR